MYGMVRRLKPKAQALAGRVYKLKDGQEFFTKEQP